MFGDEFDTSDFAELAQTLREWRFDIRCAETNVAIDANSYMVAYPFTLPHRRQMNFTASRTGGRSKDK
jgi:DNA (cytosine-5)-methyltransferase 1